MKRKRVRDTMCPYIKCDGKTPGRVWLWGMVTHENKIKVCHKHEQIYRAYGWIRVYRVERIKPSGSKGKL